MKPASPDRPDPARFPRFAPQHSGVTNKKVPAGGHADAAELERERVGSEMRDGGAHAPRRRVDPRGATNGMAVYSARLRCDALSVRKSLSLRTAHGARLLLLALSALALVDAWSTHAHAADPVAWGRAIAFREQSPEGPLVPPSRGERHVHKVSRAVHYVSIELEGAAFLRLPNVEAGREVVVGAEVVGLLPGDRAVHTVAALRATAEKTGLFTLEGLRLFSPVVYSGRILRVTLYARSLSEKEAAAVRGRLASGGLGNDAPDVHDDAALARRREQFDMVVNAAGTRTPWQWSFELRPADENQGGAPGELLTATRHILLLAPPAGAGNELRASEPSLLAPRLRRRGARLVDDTGALHASSPYVLLNVLRYHRYPEAKASALTLLRRRIEESLANGTLDSAEADLKTLGRVLLESRHLSVDERALETERGACERARLGRLRATKAGEKAAEREATLEELRAWARLRDRYPELLDEGERRELGHRIARLHETAVKLSTALGMKAPETPQEALAVRVWTERDSYKKGERIRIFLRGNRDFHARIFYRDAGGQLVQLLPNQQRTHDRFQAGVVHEVPGSGDRFTLDVTPPFGEERVIVYASTEPMRALQLRAAGPMYAVPPSEAPLGLQLRGIQVNAAPSAASGNADAASDAGAAAAHPGVIERTTTLRTTE